MITMQISKKTWGALMAFAFLGFVVWYQFSYPQLAFVKHAVDKAEALKVARSYLDQEGYAFQGFNHAIVFSLDTPANQYLQKTIGFKGLKRFVDEHDFDMFLWLIRLYREREKEEFRLAVSATTGEIVSFNHVIEEGEARAILTKTEARERVVNFLKERFDFDPQEYTVKGDFLTKKDNREDHSFSWRKKDVNIPWSDEEGSGTAKLIIGATVSGQEILSFSKNTFKVPEKFSRYISELKNTGRNLNAVILLFYTLLFMSAVYFILVKRNHLAMHLTKVFYIKIAVFSFLLSILANFNYFQEILFNYPTTSPFKDYLLRLVLNSLRGAVFVNFALLMPSLSGELLHYEHFKKKKEGSFLYYLNTTFFSRNVAASILLGYLVMVMLLGLQSFMVEVGQRYWGVWVEYSWLGQLSTAYLPFLAAFTIGFKASMSEELMFRLFAIGWGKQIFRSTVVAVIISSVVWGFAHSSYPVFPMWFRGVEVTLLGIFLSLIYLRFGIIPVIIAHFLFDAFWRSSGYLLSPTYDMNFYGCLAVLLLPLIWAVVAIIWNKEVPEKAMHWRLSKKQLFNLEVLKFYLKSHRALWDAKPKDQVVKEVSSNGWDIAVVEVAMEDLKDPGSGKDEE